MSTFHGLVFCNYLHSYVDVTGVFMDIKGMFDKTIASLKNKLSQLVSEEKMKKMQKDT
jgi:hypothetical protein